MAIHSYMFWRTIKSFFPYLRNYRREIILGIGSLLLTDFLGLVIPWILRAVIDLLPQKPSGDVLLGYMAMLFLAALFQGLSRFGWRKNLFGLSRLVEFDILSRLMSHFLTLDKAYLQEQRVGDLMSRATNDLRAIRDFVGLGLLILVDSQVVILGCLCLMFYINPRLALYCMLPLPLIPILFYKIYDKIGQRQNIVQAHLSKISAMVQETMSGVRVLHAFVQEENVKKKFGDLNREYIQKNLLLTRLFGIFTPSLAFVIGISAMISLWIGGKAVVQGEITLGSFVAFNSYLLMLSWPMMAIGYVFNLTQRGVSAMQRQEEVFLAKPVVVDHGKAASAKIEGAIEFHNLSFRYPDAQDYCLRDISCKIVKGGSVAVIGPIGTGKTTLVQLLTRIFDVERGMILIDGTPILDIPLMELRKNIGFVDQEPFLFSSSILENITFGYAEADKEEVQSVVRLAGLESDLQRFPQGLDALVGERGVSLSGGQKQRVALARALLKKPKILILDDAFSSLDVETEISILNNIKGFISGITTIIVTHRLTVARDVDRIIVLENGQIVESGTHSELMRGGYYRQISDSQSLAREMEILMQ